MSYTATVLPFVNMIRQADPIRRIVAVLLRENVFYDDPRDWHTLMEMGCKTAGYDLDPLPTIHAGFDEQLAPMYLGLNQKGKQVGALVVSMYRFRTGRYEINAHVV